MKTKNDNSLTCLIGLFCLVVMLYSCDKDDDIFDNNSSTPLRTIAEILDEEPSLSTFNNAIKEIGIDSLLANTSTFTVFAPDNEAFAGVDLSTFSNDSLSNLIMHHVWRTTTADVSSNLTTGYRNSLAAGPVENTNLSFFINVTNNNISFNSDISPVSGKIDIGGTNGVVHVVNGINLLPSVVDHLTINPNYSLLVEALQRAELVDAFTEDEIYTILAPNNDAFNVALTQLNDIFGWSTINEIPVNILTEILTYHVVVSENIMSLQINGSTLETLQSESIQIDENEINDATMTDAGIILTDTDIQGTNGVIHGIDKVLLPDTVFQQVLSVTLNLAQRLRDRGYTTFADAIELTGLSSSVSEDALTAFAPTNTAFDILFAQIDNVNGLSDFDTQEEITLLRSLVEYHLINGIQMSNQLTDGLAVTLLSEELAVATDNGIILTPTRENAPVAEVSIADIGASNGVIHEINNVLIPESLAEALGYPDPTTGGEPVFGLEIYNDSLREGMWVGDWATIELDNTNPVRSGSFSIKSTMPGGDEGFQIGGGAAFNVTDFTFVNASIYSENGTTVGFVLNQQWGSQFNVDIPAGEWTEVAVPVSSIANGTSAFEQLVIRGAGGIAGDVIFMDEVGFDVTFVASVPALDLEIYKDALRDGMWTGDWATIDAANIEPVREGTLSIKSTMPAGDEGWQIGGGASFEVSDYSFLRASIYSENSTSVGFVLNQQWGSQFDVDIPAGEWVDVEVPVSAIANGTTTFEQLVIRGAGGITGDIIFIDNVGFNE